MVEHKISVILPCYNHARFLPERIRSVLDQTYPVSEIIFLDDASNDDSFDIAKNLLKDCGIEVRFIKNIKNSGSPFAQWNKGVELARYPLIWIAETDDTCHPELVEILAKQMNTSSIVMAFSKSQFIDEEGNHIGSASQSTDAYYPSAFASSFILDGRQFNYRFMSVVNVIPNASAVLFNREAYLAAGGGNPTMKYCGDWDLWMRLLEQGDVVFNATELNYFRCHTQTTRVTIHSPIGNAETIAYKTWYYAKKQRRSSPLTLLDLLRVYWEYDYGHLKHYLYWISYLQNAEIMRFYSTMKDARPISYPVWIVISLVCGFRYAFKRLKRPEVIT